MAIFGFSVDVVENSSQLIVTTPPSIVALLLGAVFTLWPLVIALRTKPLPRHKVLIRVTVALIAFGFLLTFSRVTLDRATEMATVGQLFFYHWSSESFPLNHVAGASLRGSATTSRIMLQFTDGSSESLSYSDQTSGKDRAVYAINQFLGAR
jgi:hypothetical protein